MSRIRSLSIPWVLAMLAVTGIASCAAPITTPPGRWLAFYHPWYGTPWGPSQQWRNWNSHRFPERFRPERTNAAGFHEIASGDYPLIGPYDVQDREVVRWHFRLAKAAGLDGFLCSWWKVGRTNAYWDWQYQLFERVLLPVAAEEQFKIAVIDECAHYVRHYDSLVGRASEFLPRYAKHPAYLHLRGQPVWYVYQVWDDWLTAEQAARYVDEVQRSIGPVFWIFDKLKATAVSPWPGAQLSVEREWLAVPGIDAFAAYSLFANWRETNAAALATLYRGFASSVRAAGKQSCLPLHAGHDNTAVNAEPYVVSRDNGETLRHFWRAAEQSGGDIAVVCSFNEWPEMTHIEPAWNWPDPYRYLRLLAEWRGKKWVAPPLPPDPSVAPHLRQPLRQRFDARASTSRRAGRTED